MKKLSIIIPCHNEAKTISNIIESVLSVQIPEWEKEIIVINDASTDDTQLILENYLNVVKVIHNKINLGKGGAVCRGLELATGDYLLIQDADLEYNPEEIPSLIQALENKSGDIIYGSRNLYHIKRRGMYIPRFGVWLITKEFNLLFKTRLTDIWTCYKLFPRNVKKYFIPGKFDSELIFSARSIKNGYKIFEVPISHKPRTKYEGKHIRYRDGLNGLWIILKEFFK